MKGKVEKFQRRLNASTNKALGSGCHEQYTWYIQNLGGKQRYLCQAVQIYINKLIIITQRNFPFSIVIKDSARTIGLFVL